MKRIQNLIIFFLCLCIVGFFANFAQNEYGLKMAQYGFLAIAVLFLELMRLSISKYKASGYFVFLMTLFPLLSVIIWVYDKGEMFLIIGVLSMLAGFLYNLLVLPLLMFFKERRSGTDDISFLSYFELFFLSMFSMSLYLKPNHLLGAGVMMVLSMLVVIPFLIRLIRLFKHLFSGKSLSSFFQILVHLFVGFSIVGTVFKKQQWPYADSIFYMALSVMLFSLIVVLILRVKQSNSVFSHTAPAIKIAYFSFCATCLWLILKKNDLAPAPYSDEIPKAMQMLGAQANDVTKEGREFGRRYAIYEENLDRFMEEQNKAEQ